MKKQIVKKTKSIQEIQTAQTLKKEEIKVLKGGSYIGAVDVLDG